MEEDEDALLGTPFPQSPPNGEYDLPLDDDDAGNDDDDDERGGAVGAAGIGAFATGAAGLALVALFPQSPSNGE